MHQQTYLIGMSVRLIRDNIMTSSNGNIFRVTGHFCGEPAQRPVTRSFDVFFDLRLNKRLSKQSWGWWLETLSCPLWLHCNWESYSVALTQWQLLCQHQLHMQTYWLPQAGVTTWNINIVSFIIHWRYLNVVLVRIAAYVQSNYIFIQLKIKQVIDIQGVSNVIEPATKRCYCPFKNM